MQWQIVILEKAAFSPLLNQAWPVSAASGPQATDLTPPSSILCECTHMELYRVLHIDLSISSPQNK